MTERKAPSPEPVAVEAWPEERRDFAPPARRTSSRDAARGPQRTRASIITVATAEFAEFGLAGARVDRIARRAKANKRMIYYYFGDKDGLYQAVLLSYYEKLRAAERSLALEQIPPLRALQVLVESAFDFHIRHADVARLVMMENVNKGRHMPRRTAMAPQDAAALAAVADILRRGQEEGTMRRGQDALDLYATIIALCFFNVSNRFTFKAVFGHDMHSAREAAARRQIVWDTVWRSVIA